jgi:hypothetical protein
MTKELRSHTEKLVRQQVSISERMRRFDTIPFDEDAKPSVIVRRRGKQLLVIIGGPHSHDPRQQTFPTMDAAWEFFQAQTSPETRKIRNEGGAAPYDEDKETAIRKNSEMGVLTWLSTNHNVEMESADSMSFDEDSALLAAGFKPEDILHYYILREVPQLITDGRRPELTVRQRFQWITNYYEKQLKAIGKNPVWRTVDFSEEAIKETHRKHFGIKYFFNGDFAIEQTRDLASSDTTPQQIARYCNALRDEHFVETFFDDLDEGKSLFVALGVPHVVAIEKDMEAFGDAVSNDFATAPFMNLNKFQ